MELSNTILPLTKSVCRTCLSEFDYNNVTMFTNIQDLVEHDMNKVKLIDILVFLNCLENNDEDNWPQNMCASCVSTALLAYSFKLNCLKVNAALSQIFTMQLTSNNLPRPDVDSIDISVVYQDHEYDVPLFSSSSVLDFDSNDNNNKELIPLPPVTELTATEQLPRIVGEKKFNCNICSKSFTRISNLRYHLSKHDNIRKHLCTKCAKCFHTSNGLIQHLKSHSDIAQYKCGFCNKMYKSRQSLKEHFRVAHSSNRKLFTCTTCFKKFTAKSTLKMHLKTHSGLKEFACSNCPKTYTRASYLRSHSLVHTGQERPRPFTCVYQECERTFITKHSLLVHIAHSHKVDRPHVCKSCFKGFATLSGLKIHMETHISLDVSCSVCHRKLANKRGLQKHMKLHDTVVENIKIDQL